MSASYLLVLLPRLAAGGMAVLLARDSMRLLRGERTWILGRGDTPKLLSGWTARMFGVLFLLWAIGFGAFALFWRGPSEVP